jgi:hypothetical protein
VKPLVSYSGSQHATHVTLLLRRTTRVSAEQAPGLNSKQRTPQLSTQTVFQHRLHSGTSAGCGTWPVTKHVNMHVALSDRTTHKAQETPTPWPSTPTPPSDIVNQTPNAHQWDSQLVTMHVMMHGMQRDWPKLNRLTVCQATSVVLSTFCPYVRKECWSRVLTVRSHLCRQATITLVLPRTCGYAQLTTCCTTLWWPGAEEADAQLAGSLMHPRPHSATLHRVVPATKIRVAAHQTGASATIAVTFNQPANSCSDTGCTPQHHDQPTCTAASVS